jgi:hypothetical protein
MEIVKFETIKAKLWGLTCEVQSDIFVMKVMTEIERD